MSEASQSGPGRVVVAGSTGYLGKFVVQAFKERGYWVRVLTRSEDRLHAPGPFTAPGIANDEVDDVFVGEITKPETLAGLLSAAVSTASGFIGSAARGPHACTGE